jgi:predicted NBD/HSP70 family sugar kinase
MPPTLTQIAQRLLMDGEDLRRNGSTLTKYYARIGLSPSTVASATEGLGMSRPHDPLRVFVTRHTKNDPPLAFGPSAGLVLGVSIGYSSIRAALVDANGWIYHQCAGDAAVGQLKSSPAELFDRIKDVSEKVLDGGLHDQRLVVQGALPFLGVAVAWPGPLDRDKRFPRIALSHPLWRSNQYGIDQRLAKHLKIPNERSHAIDNAAAAAFAVGFDHTRETGYKEQREAQPMIVVRIGGGLGAASIVVEPESNDTSGWITSMLAEGHRGLAGQIGHTPANQHLLQVIEESRPEDCPEIKRVPCSCAEEGEYPDHVEAYASCPALAARFTKTDADDITAVVREVLGKRATEPYRHALRDVGALVADCLLPSVLMMNPHSVVLTGGLATEEVRSAVEEYLEDFEALGRIFGEVPEVTALEADANDYVRVRGAALAVLRKHVHGRVDELYGSDGSLLEGRFAELTMPITGYPWT